jgi:ribosome-associated translation inhibitor RaiA
MEPALKITFRDLAPSPALEARIQTWVTRLASTYDRIGRCDVVISAPHRHQHKGHAFSVHLTLSLPGEQLVVTHDAAHEGAHADPYVAVRDAFRAMRRQLREHVRRRFQQVA